MTNLPTNPDVVIVGAGTAGLSAATELQRLGFSIIVLEAAGYIGGRCVTDQNTFSTPFDRGGSWLHSAPVNPLAQIAMDRGAKVHPKPWAWNWVQSCGCDLTPNQVTDYRRYQEQLWPAVDGAGGRDVDCTPWDAMPDGAWVPIARHSVAQMLAGDGDVTSATDSRNYEKADGDWLVEGGLGKFVCDVLGNVPIVLNCPVTEIDHSGGQVEVSTPKGKISTQHVVITVSTGVLASGVIKFKPTLSVDKIQSFHDLPNGLLNKIGIEFDPAWAGALQGQMADYHTSNDAFCSILFGFFDSSFATGFVAGRCAKALEDAGPGAATDLCREALRSIFGSSVEKHILKTDETAWGQCPTTLGSYSYAKTGCAGARKILANPESDRLFFAGEASMKETYSTVHGAYLSGLRAVQQMLSTLEQTKTTAMHAIGQNAGTKT